MFSSACKAWGALTCPVLIFFHAWVLSSQPQRKAGASGAVGPKCLAQTWSWHGSNLSSSLSHMEMQLAATTPQQEKLWGSDLF